MCGITGFITAGNEFTSVEMERILIAMSDAIVHRGPDHGGSWSNVESGVWLGHKRLAIVDLSPSGHQPMQSPSGRYMIVFNGEIYNHLLLRQMLKTAGQSPSWRGHSDTETLLVGFDTWGIQKTVTKLIGMFAFAVWDRQNKALTLGRDRLGEAAILNLDRGSKQGLTCEV